MLLFTLHNDSIDDDFDLLIYDLYIFFLLVDQLELEL